MSHHVDVYELKTKVIQVLTETSKQASLLGGSLMNAAPPGVPTNTAKYLTATAKQIESAVAKLTESSSK